MTETQWLDSNDPLEMLNTLNVGDNFRKLRLFICACWRASGGSTEWFSRYGADGEKITSPMQATMDWASMMSTIVTVSQKTTMIRDIFGNPYTPVAFAPEWRTKTAMTVARNAYDLQEFACLPVLADALEEAGCHSDEVLTHCRSDDQHFRGCWVLDAVLMR